MKTSLTCPATLTLQPVRWELAGIPETRPPRTPTRKEPPSPQDSRNPPVIISHITPRLPTPVPWRASSYPSSRRSMSALRLLLIREWEFRSSSSQFLKFRPVKPLGLRLMSCSGIPGGRKTTGWIWVAMGDERSLIPPWGNRDGDQASRCKENVWRIKATEHQNLKSSSAVNTFTEFSQSYRLFFNQCHSRIPLFCIFPLLLLTRFSQTWTFFTHNECSGCLLLPFPTGSGSAAVCGRIVYTISCCCLATTKGRQSSERRRRRSFGFSEGVVTPALWQEQEGDWHTAVEILY